MRNGHLTGTLTTANIQEFTEIGGRIIEIYEREVDIEFFKTSPFEGFIGKLFNIRNIYKIEVTVGKTKLIKDACNGTYAQTFSKDTDYVRESIIKNEWKEKMIKELLTMGKYPIITLSQNV